MTFMHDNFWPLNNCIFHNNLSSGKIVLFSWDILDNWQVLFVSQSVESVFGYSAEKFESMEIEYASLIHPDDIDRVRKEVMEGFASGKDEFTHELYRIKDAAGNYRNVYDHSKMIRNESGEVTEIHGYISDETEIVQQKLKLELVLQSTQMGIWDWYPETNQVVFDERWTRMLGCELDEIEPVFDSWQSRLHPDDIEKTFKNIQAHLKGDAPYYESVHRLRHKDGSWRYILDRGQIVEKDQSGNPLRFTGTHTDITELKRMELQLQEQQSLNQTMIDSANALIAVIDLDGVMIRLNTFGENFLGYSESQVARKPNFWHQFIQPDHSQMFLDKVDRCLSGKQALNSFNIAWRRYSAVYHMIEWSMSTLKDVHGKVMGVFLVGIDIQESYKLTEKLHLANTVIHNAINGVMITDKQNRIVDVNDSFLRIIGRSKDELIGNFPSFNKSGLQDDAFYQKMWSDLSETGAWQGEVTNRRKDGSLFTCLLSITVIRDSDGNVTNYVAIFADITDFKKTEKRLDFIASHDVLTSLPNRTMFQEELNHAVARSSRAKEKLALIYFDVDRFKNINDSFGHPLGDELLVKVVERVAGVIDKADTFARLGGDEFVILVENMLDTESIGFLARSILEAFDHPFLLDSGPEVLVSVSVGISIFPEDASDATNLLMNADASMYTSKSLGGNQYQFYNKALTDEVRKKLKMEALLRKAIENNELSLHYQPKFSLKSKKVSGVEALLRWHSAEIGFVSPAEFIPLSEETGLIHKISDWVYEKAIEQARDWVAQDIRFNHIAVNISVLQIEKGGLPEKLSQLLTFYNVPANAIELEITESVFVHNQDHVLDQLTQLRNLGFKISIDDFGTGYSSLSYLKKLPIDILKIDSSFVMDIPDDKDDMAITRTVIAMGKAMGLDLVAEGAETQQQVEFLTTEGCQFVQGYFFSRPLPPQQCLEFIKQHC